MVAVIHVKLTCTTSMVWTIWTINKLFRVLLWLYICFLLFQHYILIFILIDIQSVISFFDISVPGGRLECTMQNIADNFTNTYSSRCYKGVEGLEYVQRFASSEGCLVYIFVLTMEITVFSWSRYIYCVQWKTKGHFFC